MPLRSRPGWVIVSLLLVASVSSAGMGCARFRSDSIERVRQMQDVEGDFAGSVEPLRRMIEKHPDSPELDFRYGMALVQTGSPSLAIWPLKRAMDGAGWLKKAGLPLVELLLASGAYGEAIEICDKILLAEPDDVPTLISRANARLLSRRDYEGSLADADRALQLDPENHAALTPRTVALLALNRIDDAAKAIDQLEALYRDDSLGLHGNAGLCVARATFAKEKGEQKLAEERFEGCLKDFPEEPVAISAAIGFFDSIDRVERANEVLAQALERTPGSYEIRSTLALRLAGQKKEADAEALLRKGTESTAGLEAAEAWGGLAAFLLDRGRNDEAVAAFEKARSLDTTQSPQLALAYADALVLVKRYDDALAVADTMTIPAHQAMVRARVALARGDSAEALKLFENGMRLWPNNAVARYYAGVAAEQSGEFKRAIEHYRYAMRIDSEETDAYLRLARLQVAAGHDRAALDVLEFAPGGRPDELAAALLHTRLLARQGKAKEAPGYVRGLLGQPANRGAAVAATGQGIRDRNGPKAALEAMRAAKIDLKDPGNVAALAEIAEDLAATGKASEAVALAEASARAHPDAADFHAVLGRALVLSHAPAGRAHAEFERALELDAKNARALLGLARLEAGAGDPDQALALFDRAIAADPDSPVAAREAAALLVSLKRPGDAEAKLDELLRDQPSDGEAARSLAELRLERGANDERTHELAHRAVQFGGGAEAKALLERVSAGAPSPQPAPSAQKTG